MQQSDLSTVHHSNPAKIGMKNRTPAKQPLKSYGLDVPVKVHKGNVFAQAKIRVGGFHTIDEVDRWTGEVVQAGRGYITSRPKMVTMTATATAPLLRRPPEAMTFVHNIPKHIAELLTKAPGSPAQKEQTSQPIGQPHAVAAD